MNKWKDNETEKQMFGGSSGDKIPYIKIKDGDKCTFRILGKYKFYRDHWIAKIKRSPVCCGTDCPICQAGSKGNLKYAVNIIDRADGQVKLWFFTRRVKIALMNIADDYGSLDNYDVIVRRAGSGMNDTVYTVNPAREEKPLTKAEKEVKTFNLDEVLAPTTVDKMSAMVSGEQVTQSKKEQEPSNVKEELPVADSNDVEDLPTLA